MKIYCPLLSAAYKANKECKGPECAWFRRCDKCAILCIADSLANTIRCSVREH